MRRDRPAVVLECRVKADTPEKAGTFGSEVIKRVLDLMTLRRGAAARLIGGVVGQQTEPGRYDVRTLWIKHSGYTGNLMGGIISGEDVHGLQASWSGLQANPQAQLWASLYADAVRDTRWDYQFFRCFNLLEAIADEADNRMPRLLMQRVIHGRFPAETAITPPSRHRVRSTNS